MDKIIGIYCIRNIVNNKKYIGQSGDIYKRWRDHKEQLRKNNHYNSYLQKSWNKYGEKNFEFSIVETCQLEKLNEREKYYIKLYDTHNYINGYNMNDGGDGNRGYKFTDEQREHIREVNKRRKYSPEHNKKISETLKNKIKNGYMPKIEHLFQYNKEFTQKVIDCYDSYGNYLRTYESIHEAARDLNLEATNISKTLLKKHNHCGKYVFYYNDEPTPNKIDIFLRCSKNPICLFNLDNELIEIYHDALECALDIGGDSSWILKVCNGKRKTCRGYTMKYYYDVFPKVS